MLRSIMLKSLAAGGLALMLAVQPAEASEELTSSMTAACVGAGGSCDVVDFFLTSSGPDDVYFDFVRLFGQEGAWKFAALDGVWADGVATGWSAFFNNGNLEVKVTGGVRALSPVRIRVQMSQFSTDSDFALMNYSANGYAGPTGNEGFASTEGAVTTPEPVSTILLGTGLAGLVAVGRKRRNLLEGEEEAV